MQSSSCPISLVSHHHLHAYLGLQKTAGSWGFVVETVLFPRDAGGFIVCMPWRPASETAGGGGVQMQGQGALLLCSVVGHLTRQSGQAWGPLQSLRAVSLPRIPAMAQKFLEHKFLGQGAPLKPPPASWVGGGCQNIVAVSVAAVSLPLGLLGSPEPV